jgi:hypothetical protein
MLSVVLSRERSIGGRSLLSCLWLRRESTHGRSPLVSEQRLAMHYIAPGLEEIEPFACVTIAQRLNGAVQGFGAISG